MNRLGSRLGRDTVRHTVRLQLGELRKHIHTHTHTNTSIHTHTHTKTDPSPHTRSKHHLLVRNLPGLSTLSSQGRSSTHCGFDYTTSEELGKSPGAMARLG